MLSRVAERIYWGARYLERVENTARLLSVYDNLLYDLPRNTNISWYNLIRINSDNESFNARYKVQDERNVVKFILADDSNPNSVLSCLKMVKENIRTTRDVVPQSTWELVNELDLFTRNNIRLGINRSERHPFLNSIIQRCQEISGLFEGSMSRDATWQFMTLGRNLERADMTTRILDAGATVMLQPNEQTRVNLSQVVWGNVLRSLSADLNYRRAIRSSVSGKKVVQFLIEDLSFPRTLKFCSQEMLQAAEHLPRADIILGELKGLEHCKYNPKADEGPGEHLREYLNEVQIKLCNLHGLFAENWFSFNSTEFAQSYPTELAERPAMAAGQN